MVKVSLLTAESETNFQKFCCTDTSWRVEPKLGYLPNLNQDDFRELEKCSLCKIALELVLDLNTS